MIGYEAENSPISSYQPSEEVRQFTIKVKKAYAEGVRILENNYLEFNDRNVIDEASRGQMMFNAFVDTNIDDPNEDWQIRTTRSLARNKGIAMHAQLTGSFLLPLYIAQNEDDEIDKGFSEVMQDIAEWMAQPANSDYQSAFLQITLSMLYNPVTYLGADFCQVYQKIRDGGKIKEVLDEVLSGFKCPIWGPTEVLISNAYERNIQKQKCIIQRRFAEKEELEAKYGDHPNWPYVQTGIKSVYNEEDGLFYDIKDEDHPGLVAEEIYKERQEDCEAPFVNGIYLGDKDVENNPIKHRDNRNCPKYNIVPFGYARIGDHFFYYKSMMNILGWENMMYDAMSEIIYNRAILENEMPIGISGSDEINSEVIFPKSVVTFENADAKITPLLPPSNLASGFNVLREAEKGMSEGSVNESISGQLPDANQKAFNVAQAQANAKKLIGVVGKSLAESMVQYGDLMKDIILNHITSAQVDELIGGKMKMKHKTFILENKTVGGKMANRNIKFDSELIGQEMTDDEKLYKEIEMMEKIGYLKEVKSLRVINPQKFALFKYFTKIDIQEMFTRTNEYWQPILMQLKQLLAQDPSVNQEGLTRKLLYSIFNSEGEDLIKEQAQQIPGLPTMPPQEPMQPKPTLNQVPVGNVIS